MAVEGANLESPVRCKSVSAVLLSNDEITLDFTGSELWMSLQYKLEHSLVTIITLIIMVFGFFNTIFKNVQALIENHIGYSTNLRVRTYKLVNRVGSLKI